MAENIAKLIVFFLKQVCFQPLLTEFFTQKLHEHANFIFWWKYMDTVTILFIFTRAKCDGIWDLDLYSFSLMLPYFMCHDHYNFAHWGPIYLAEIHKLPATVLLEFQKGKFVVKHISHKFNQVDLDQA